MEPSLYLGSLPLILEGEETQDTPRGVLDTHSFEVLAEPALWKASLEDLGIIKETVLPTSFGFHSMWVRDYRIRERSAAAVKIAVSCIGLAENSDKRKTTLNATANRISIGPEEKKIAPLTDMNGNIIEWNVDGSRIVNADGELVPRELYPIRIFGGETGEGHPAWSVATPKITLTSTWFTTTYPDPNVAGKEMTPPLTIETPTNELDRGLWDWVSTRRNAPYGWVCDSRSIEPLFIGFGADSPDYTPPPEGTPLTQHGLWAVVDVMSYYFRSEVM